MTKEVSMCDLSNRITDVVAAVTAGEIVTLIAHTVPIADIVPHATQRDPWVSSSVLREILRDAPADKRLLGDVSEVRSTLVDDA